MKPSLIAMLNETEQALLRESEPEALAGLDEDELSELHDRIRRARNKYTKMYRRRAAGQVGADATRGRASKVHARSRVKAEAFEDALARVSASLAKAARAAAKELRDERLAAARGETDGPGKGGTGRARTAKPAGTASAKAKQRTPVRKRAAASARATNKRGQAKRAAR